MRKIWFEKFLLCSIITFFY